LSLGSGGAILFLLTTPFSVDESRWQARESQMTAAIREAELEAERPLTEKQL
jgi:hypothetical protein